ncbi:ParB/RepB/Spo0J family partition protein [Candidatus Binatus sp.]|uniref:ParB/RepB/Spo0J family partition protein n=1 Tax=Candidatus Binatus sp. TaxID=2811406 RepID=UPI003CA67299
MMRKPLGRGLDALIGNAAAEIETGAEDSGGGQFKMAPIGSIAPGEFQPRINFDKERLAELTLAIQSQGIIEPLIVRRIDAPESDGPRYELIAGERRLRAARAAGLETVPVVVRELDDRAALEMSLVENIVREDLNAVEEGLAFFRLFDHFGLTHDQIAARVGKSRPYVGNSIRLLELPQPILNMIAKGELNAGQARPLLSIESAEAQLSAARRIAAVGISARGAEEMVTANRPRNTKTAVSRAAADANLNALAEGLQRALKRKVRIFKRRGRNPGRIEIDYYDDNDLTAVAEILLGNTRASMRA